MSHYSRGERRFKNRHFGKSPTIQTVIANTDYGTNKYWKKRRNRAITQARFAKYSDTASWFDELEPFTDADAKFWPGNWVGSGVIFCVFEDLAQCWC